MFCSPSKKERKNISPLFEEEEKRQFDDKVDIEDSIAGTFNVLLKASFATAEKYLSNMKRHNVI